MAGFKTPESPEFEHWMMSTAEDLENSLLHVLKLLSDHSSLNGDLVSSLYWLKRSLEYDPMDANLQHRYLLVLKQLGRMIEANHYYDHLVDLYRQEELGELPNSIQDLYQQIQTVANLPPRASNHSLGLPPSTCVFLLSDVNPTCGICKMLITRVER